MRKGDEITLFCKILIYLSPYLGEDIYLTSKLPGSFIVISYYWIHPIFHQLIVYQHQPYGSYQQDKAYYFFY